MSKSRSTIYGFPFDFVEFKPRYRITPPRYHGEDLLLPESKPKRKKLVISVVREVVTIETVTTKVEIVEDDEGNEGPCPAALRPSSPAGSPGVALIENTTVACETVKRSVSIAVPLGSPSGRSSFGETRSASGAYAAAR